MFKLTYNTDYFQKSVQHKMTEWNMCKSTCGFIPPKEKAENIKRLIKHIGQLLLPNLDKKRQFATLGFFSKIFQHFPVTNC